MISRVKEVHKVNTGLSLTKRDSKDNQGQKKHNNQNDFERLLNKEMNKEDDKGMKKVLRP